MDEDQKSKATLDKEREQRIQARRERIQQKIASAHLGGETDAAAERKRKKEQDFLLPRGGLEEVENSRRRLARFAAERNDEVTQVRVETDEREMQRRTTEEALRVDRRHKLLFEAESSARRNAAIAMKWTSLFEVEVPLDLYNDMKTQQNACWRIIEAKDNLIRDFQTELKSKDEQYVKFLRQGVADLDQLQETMAKNAMRQRMLFEQELQGLEAAFEKERKGLIKQCSKEWDEVFEKSLKQQLDQKDLRTKRVDQDEQRLLLLHRQDTEDFHTLTIRLETEKQGLEQQLEDMRATYQLNTEKLDYNHRVLTERNDENRSTIDANKRKIARLQDNLSSLMQKYGMLDKKYKTENQELSEAYQRYTQLFMDLQEKFQHFQRTDAKRFLEIWMMHEKETKAKLLKCLQADKIVHEQMLGLLWFPPSEEELNRMFDHFREKEMGKVMAKMKLDNTKQETDVTENAAWDKELRECLQSQAIKDMALMVSDNTHFLQDAQLEKTLQSVPREKGELMQVKHVFKALGIESARDIRVLLAFFTIDGAGSDHPIEATDIMRQNLNQDLDLVSEVEVVACLKRFLDHRKSLEGPEDLLESTVAQARPHPMSAGLNTAVANQMSANSQDLDTLGPMDSAVASAMPHSGFDHANVASVATVASGSTEASHAMRTPLSARSNHSPPTASGGGARTGSHGHGAGVESEQSKAIDSPMGMRLGRMSTDHGFKSVWELAEKVIPVNTTKVWHELHRFQVQYNAILQERADTIEEVDSMREQNRELKMLLNQYLTSKVNGQLYVPPTATIARVDG